MLIYTDQKSNCHHSQYFPISYTVWAIEKEKDRGKRERKRKKERERERGGRRESYIGKGDGGDGLIFM